MFMYPIFITDDPDASVVIPTLPGQRRWGVNQLEGFLGPLVQKGLRSVILFGVPLKCHKVRAPSIARPLRTLTHARTNVECQRMTPTALSFRPSKRLDLSSPSSTLPVTCVSASTRHTVTVESSSPTVRFTPNPPSPVLPKWLSTTRALARTASRRAI